MSSGDSLDAGAEPRRVLHAFAKLTLSLRVTGVREDGYHLLDAEMVELDLSDEIELDLERRGGFEVLDEVDWCGLPGTAAGSADHAGDDDAADAERSDSGAGTEPRNLVLLALDLAGRSAGCRLHKRIPAGAGLGGGSADAAAILRWAGISDLQVAARLGADVPFCLVGGRARVSGIGEIVEPLPPVPLSESGAGSGYILLAPRVHVSTPVVYRAWDELGGPRGDSGNDLEPAALAAYPGLRWWRDLLGAATGKPPRLAGSGGTWFVEWPLEGAGDIARQIRGEVVAGRESAFVTVARSSFARPQGRSEVE